MGRWFPLSIALCLSAAASVRAAEREPSGRPAWLGLSPTLSLTETSGVTAQPDAYSNVLGLGLGLSWAAGRLLLPGGYGEPLTLSASWGLSAELAGTGAAYRDGEFANPAQPDHPVPSQACLARLNAGAPVGNECFERHVEGAGKRLDHADVRLGAAHGRLATVPGAGLELGASLGATLPTSRASRNLDVYTSLAPGLSLARGFWRDRVRASYGLTFTKTFARWTTRPAVGGDDGTLAYEPGGRLTSHALTHAWGAGVRLPADWEVSVAYALHHAWAFPLERCTVAAPGSSTGTVDVCAARPGAVDDGYTLRTGAAQAFSLGLGWSPRGWLALSLTMATTTPLRKPDSRGFYQPLLHTDRNGFTTLGVTAAITFDRLYQEAP